MSKTFVPRQYKGSYENFWTSLSVQDLINAGVKIYWHENLYERVAGMEWRAEDKESTKWHLLRNENDLPDARCDELIGHIQIFYRLMPQHYAYIRYLEAEAEDAEERYWKKWVEENGERVAIERANSFHWDSNNMADECAEGYFYESQIAPETRV